MKKIYLSLLAAGAFAGAHAQQMAPRPMNHKLIDNGSAQVGTPGTLRASSIALGNAQNMLTVLLSGQNQVSYNPELNSVLFVHRQNAADNGGVGAGNAIRFDVSTDGGATFQLNKLLTPGILAGTTAPVTACRYPQITIWNPSGNTDPANAYAVSTGATLNSVNAGQWGIIQASSAKFDGSNNVDAYFDIFGDNTTFHAYGMHTDVNGNMWALASRLSTTTDNADSVDYSSFSVLKGVFNTGTNSVDWTVSYSLPWDVFVYNDPDNGITAQAVSWNIGFSPDGQTGYAVINGTQSTTLPRPAPHPNVYKTTDGGSSWAPLPIHDFSTDQWVVDNIPGANDTQLPRPYFSDMDMTVDANGKLHMITEVITQSLGNSSDSANYVFVDLATQFIVHAATTDGVTWDLETLSNVLGEDYQWPPQTTGGGPFQSNRPQASRTADGTKLFFSWNSSGDTETENILPDMYCAGLNATTGLWTATKNLTLNTNAEGAAWFHTVAPISITGGADYNYEIPTVYAEPGAEDVDVCGFFYLKGVGFNDAEFAFGIGITENAIDNKVAVFPNPTNGAVEVMLNDLGTVELSVVDVTGRMVAAERTSKLQHTLDITSQPAGIYMLTIRSEQGQTTRRIVKQ
ncbi:MAG: T9SS type A sorting domain-containing protein [Flavobacteriales bacterium]|nr:T9SS type A sorting domain-containing protein [Flavobacteriales bacterium]